MKKENTIIHKYKNVIYTILISFKNKQLKRWFYEFKHGHEFLLKEEVSIIYETRLNNKYKWVNENIIKQLIKIKVKEMYKKKFPDAKRWVLPIFYC